MARLHSILKALTGEYLLDRHPNSSTVIVIRTLQTSVELFVLAVVLKSLMRWEFRPRDSDYVTWFGAIAAAVYAAFYARFASQWSYLANLYNQIKQLEASTQRQPSGSDRSGPCPLEHVAALKAAFIEDSETLHLAGQKSFKYAVATWSKQPCVIQAFTGTVDGELARLRAIAEASVREIRPPFRPRPPLACRAFAGYRVSLETGGDDQCSGFQKLDG
jgi:hypothetical protein